MIGRKVRLEEIVHFNYGKSLKADERNGGPFNVYGSNGVVGQHSEKIIDYDTIIVGRKGSVGKVTMALGGGWPIDTTYYVEIKDDNSVNLRYLYYALEKADLVQHSITTSIPGINRETLNSVEIWLPHISEQKRIADILDKADEIKHNIHKMKDLKKQTELSIFLDMFGDPVGNSKGWDVQKLGQITDGVRSGSTPKGGSKNYVEDGITFFRSQNVWRNKIEFSDVAYIDEKMHLSMKKTSLKKNDILITKTGRINTENSSLGRAALFTGEDDTANINGHVYYIRLSDSSFLHEFVVYILTTDIFREYIRSVCVGGIDKRQLNKNHIENFPIISPSLDLQKNFISKIKQLSSLTKNSRINLPITLTNSVSQEMLT